MFCRCDGSFRIFEAKKPFASLYLHGINGDNVAYVTQASTSLTLTTREGVKISGDISDTNFRHTDEVLYIDLHPHDAEMLKKSDKPIAVKFSLKSNYFKNLKEFINSLSKYTISCLLPSAFPEFYLQDLDKFYEKLPNLKSCSEDQNAALVKIVSCPSGRPPLLVTGPFGTGKTHILAVAAHYFLQNITSETTILVCTQQHTSADAFLEYALNLCVPMPKDVYIARVRNFPKHQRGKDNKRYLCNYTQFGKDFQSKPPTKKKPYLVVTTCQGAHQLSKDILKGFHFTHIFIDEVGHMREAEAVAPLTFAGPSTKVFLAGDKQQVCCCNYNINLRMYQPIVKKLFVCINKHALVNHD